MPNTMHTLRGLLALLAIAIAGALAVVVVIAAPTSAQAERSASDQRIVKAGAVDPDRGPLSAVQKRALSQGYLVPDQAAYERDKAEAAEKAQRRSGEPSSTASGSKAPASIRTWEGVSDPSFSPPDSTGAIGTTRYVELVNSKFAIYNRTSNVPLSSGTLNTLAGGTSATVFDPQVIWDPETNRFYYVMDKVFSGTDNRIAFGFSKTATPSSAADFCKYERLHGSEFPDYPKLGDIQGLLLYGTNTFSGTTGSYLGSDLYSITKPPAGTTCPAASTFKLGAKLSLKSADGTGAQTPVPANQTDTSSVGYAVARASSNPATFVPVYTITKNATTGALTVAAPRSLAVPSYSAPANASQPSTTNKLDTLDGRMTQAVSAIDPRFGRVALWTQHTTFGGFGAEVRWYEVNPSAATPSLFQSGIATGASGRYIFNGAISPDRARSGTTAKFGGNMVLNYNSSSTTQFPDIRMRSKVGAGLISPEVLVKRSAFSHNDFTCASGTCRWGDYAAATPDPNQASTTATKGRVWSTSMFVKTANSWGSWNWAATP